MNNSNRFISKNINITTFDPLLKDALLLFINHNRASITLIQRFFNVGYVRGAGIVEQMEQNGFISPVDDNNCRQLLISLEEYEKIFNSKV